MDSQVDWMVLLALLCVALVCSALLCVCFRDGSPLQNLVTDLASGSVDPLREPRLRLKVARWPGRGLVSIQSASQDGEEEGGSRPVLP